MTASELLWLMLRRWYLVALGAVLTMGVAYVATHRAPVYWTEYTVVLLAPIEEYYPNKIEDPRHALAPMAGLVVADWNQDHRPLITAAGDTAIYGEGLRDGVVVRQPNMGGGQWEPQYTTPNIDVQVIGADPAEVEQRARQTTATLAALLKKRQDDAKINPNFQITLIASPGDYPVTQIGGNRTRGLVAAGVVGVSLTGLGTYWLERGAARRRRRRTEALESETPAETSRELLESRP